MKKQRAIFLILLLLHLPLLAQPGGGGGIKIMSVLDYNGRPIAKDDPNFSFKRFVLNDKTHKPTAEFALSEAQESHYRYSDPSRTFIYVPPFIRKPNTTREKALNCQRLMLFYGKDTMTIDLIDVMPENGAGHSDIMQKVYFEAGYYKCYRNPAKSHPALWQDPAVTPAQKDEILRSLENGINSASQIMLISTGLLQRVPHPYLYDKQLERARNACTDTLEFYGYRTLCFDNVEARDSILNLRTTRTPLAGDSVAYRFMYFFTDSRFTSQSHTEAPMARNLLAQFNTYGLQINGVPFTGCLKLAQHYQGFFKSLQEYYTLRTIYYANGQLVKIRYTTVTDLITETIGIDIY